MSLKTWWARLTKKKVPAPAPPPVVPAPPPVVPAPPPAPPPPTVPKPVLQPTFIENFKIIDPSRWRLSTWEAPGLNSMHSGLFSAEHVSIGEGGLCLKLSQRLQGSKIVSTGAEIVSREKFHYGTYEFVVRASSTANVPTALGNPVSGSITGCFNYLPDSETEIDVEFEGNSRSSLTQFTSWRGSTNSNEHSESQPISVYELPHQAFITYKFVWMPGRIEYFRNGILLAVHTKVVPSAPAFMVFNHWGTSDRTWGGLGTTGVDRFMYVKSFKYTAAT